jgi:MFS family permease
MNIVERTQKSRQKQADPHGNILKQKVENLPLIGPRARLGLIAIFGSTLFQLSGILMLSPLLILMLKQAEVSTTVAGVFAATSWFGVVLITPFASMITRRIGRRRSLWFASALPLLTAFGFLLTDNLAVWFLLELLASIAGGLRWVVAEAYIAEFAPRDKLGRFVGMYATMLGLTFVIGPALLAWVGTQGHTALWIVIALIGLGLGWTALIPRTKAEEDASTAPVGLRGLKQALTLHPVIMLAGFVGGFFELGLSSILRKRLVAPP